MMQMSTVQRESAQKTRLPLWTWHHSSMIILSIFKQRGRECEDAVTLQMPQDEEEIAFCGNRTEEEEEEGVCDICGS
jgi:hypothetical protein